MSAETKTALETALAAHIADVTDGNVLTDYAMVIASTELDDIGTGETNYFFEANEGQPQHVSLGLIQYAATSSIWLEDDEDY